MRTSLSSLRTRPGNRALTYAQQIDLLFRIAKRNPVTQARRKRKQGIVFTRNDKTKFFHLLRQNPAQFSVTLDRRIGHFVENLTKKDFHTFVKVLDSVPTRQSQLTGITQFAMGLGRNAAYFSQALGWNGPTFVLAMGRENMEMFARGLGQDNGTLFAIGLDKVPHYERFRQALNKAGVQPAACQILLAPKNK